MRKSKVITLNQLNIKNNKISKDNFEKIIKEKICGGILGQLMENQIHQTPSRESCILMQTDNAATF